MAGLPVTATPSRSVSLSKWFPEITAVVAAEARAAGEKHVDEGDGADKIVGFLESIKVL